MFSFCEATKRLSQPCTSASICLGSFPPQGDRDSFVLGIATDEGHTFCTSGITVPDSFGGLGRQDLEVMHGQTSARGR